jgi:hypothetical protein
MDPAAKAGPELPLEQPLGPAEPGVAGKLRQEPLRQAPPLAVVEQVAAQALVQQPVISSPMTMRPCQRESSAADRRHRRTAEPSLR